MRQIKFLGDLRHKLCAVHVRLDEGSEARALLDGAIKTIDNEIGGIYNAKKKVAI